MKTDNIPFQITGTHAKNTMLNHLKNLIVMIENNSVEHVQGGLIIRRDVEESGVQTIVLESDLTLRVLSKNATPTPTTP